MTDAEFIKGMIDDLEDHLLSDEIMRLQAIAQRLEDDEWQPIETAPPVATPQ